MKYLKFTLLLLVVSVVINYTFTLAYSADELPVSGTVSINKSKWDSTDTRSKTNYSYQRLKIRESTCSDCTYYVNTYVGGGAVSTNQNISLGVAVNLNNSNILTGSTYAKIRSSKWSLISITAGYTYDPNQLLL